MAEITAGMVKELREKTGLRHDGMQEGADGGRGRHRQSRGDPAHQAAATRRARPQAAWRRKAWSARTFPPTASRRDRRSQLRDRFRREKRGVLAFANGLAEIVAQE